MSRASERQLVDVAQELERMLRRAVDVGVPPSDRSHLAHALELVWEAYDEMALYRCR